MKVVLVCHSDMLGGAAVVTFRLMEALRLKGVDARMVVYTKLSDSPWVSQVSGRFCRGVKFIWERGVIYLHNGMRRSDLFKVSIADTGMDLWNHPWVKEADVINLNWVNQGLLSLSGIRRLGAMGKPLVWTMHDMWCLTGICHHAYQCTRYTEECGRCPFLHSHRANDLSHRVWKRKRDLYGSTPITFVAVSNWLADCCRRSSLLGDARLEVIPNAFPIDSFPTVPYDNFPAFDPIESRRRIVFGAARLDDPIKGLDKAIEALNHIFDNHPEVCNDTTLVLFGNINNPALLDTIRFPHIYLGRVTDARLLRQIYASASVVLSTSAYETLPGTLIEGQAAGCLPVTFGQGGQADIVTHRRDGYIARYGDTADVARGVMWALEQEVDRDALHLSVKERFAADVVADRFIALYQSLLG